MGDTMAWLAGQFASLIPNTLPVTTAAASSSSGGFGGCGVLVDDFSVCNNRVACGPHKSQVQKSFTFVSNCGQAVTLPAENVCCPGVA
jgi:hypothetical protein